MAKPRNSRGQSPDRLKELGPAPYNPRQISDRARGGLRNSLEAFGDISGITYNFRTGNLVAGHQRSGELLALDAGEIEWGEWRDTEIGRERFGSVQTKNGARFNVRGVDWPLAKEKAANVAANSSALSGTFTEGLNDILDELKDDPELFEALRFDDLTFVDVDVDGAGGGSGGGDGGEPRYTNKILSPVYTPTGPKPPVSELVDDAKVSDLLAEIDSADGVPEEVRDFLRAAATRHLVFNYRRIAEFYAQSPKEVQSLFERSALVIIDFDAAIENGFVIITERLHDAFDRNAESTPEEDEGEGDE